jgi:threonine aldolase
MNFASDNWAGVPEAVTAAIAAAADGFAPAYGDDPITREAEERISALFERRCSTFFVATGTAANSLALSVAARPGGVVLCHEEAHIVCDEGGAPEFLGGGLKVMGRSGPRGMLSADLLAATLSRYREGDVHQGRLVAVSLTQATESGTVYQPETIRAIADAAKARGLMVHMDGARFANAVARLGCSPAETSWKAGVDVMSFGLTKVGAWAAEAVVFFDPALADGFGHTRKRAGHLFSKSRFVAAQFLALLKDGLWLDLAAHANAMAERLATGLAVSGRARLAYPPEGNEVFAVLSKTAAVHLREAGATFHPWSVECFPAEDRPTSSETLVRLVTSFRTSEDEVDRFVALLGK